MRADIEERDPSKLVPCHRDHGDKHTIINVQKPVTHNTWENGKYTSYEILLQTSDGAFSLSQSCVRRRYSDFKWLRSQLARHYHEKEPPQLPTKAFFASRFSTSVIESRMEGFRQFIEGVLKEVIYLSDSAVHLFLQTELSPADMEKCMNGETDAGVLDTILEAGKQQNSAQRDTDSTEPVPVHIPGTNRLVPAPLSLPIETGSGEEMDPHTIFSPTRPPCTPPGHLFGRSLDTTEGGAMSSEVWVTHGGSSGSSTSSPLSQGAGPLSQVTHEGSSGSNTSSPLSQGAGSLSQAASQKAKPSALKSSVPRLPMTASLERISINASEEHSVSESDCSVERDSDFCSDSSSLSGEVVTRSSDVVTRPDSKQRRKRRTVRFSTEVLVAQVVDRNDSGYNDLEETTRALNKENSEASENVQS